MDGPALHGACVDEAHAISPQRRRFATRDELTKLLAERLRQQADEIDGCSGCLAVAALDFLADMGVNVGALVEITAAEPPHVHRARSLAERIADAQPRIKLH